MENVVKILLDGQEQDFVVAEEKKVAGILSKKDLIKGLSDFGETAPVSNAMQTDYISLQSEMPLQEVFQNMMLKKCHVALVMDNNAFISIVDRENIYEFLMVKESISGKLK